MSVTVTPISKSGAVSVTLVSQTGSLSLTQGSPIGLLLALTYAQSVNQSGLSVTLIDKN